VIKREKETHFSNTTQYFKNTTQSSTGPLLISAVYPNKMLACLREPIFF